MCYHHKMKLSVLILLLFGLILGLSYFQNSRQTGQMDADEDGNEKFHSGYEEPATETRIFVIDIINSAFNPPVLTVEKGSTVAFINRDDVLHTATAENAGTNEPTSFDLGELKTNEQISAARYDESGTFEYHCKIHPEMKGKVIVK